MSPDEIRDLAARLSFADIDSLHEEVTRLANKQARDAIDAARERDCMKVYCPKCSGVGDGPSGPDGEWFRCEDCEARGWIWALPLTNSTDPAHDMQRLDLDR